MNLYDVLAGQGTTHFERLFSQKFAGGGKTQTLTGQPPLSFKANGEPLISWSMKGNGQQQGTPTPDAPIQPTFCGVRTRNLCPMIFSHSGIGDDVGTIITMNTRLWSSKIAVLPSQSYYAMINGEASNQEELLFNRIIQYDANGEFISRISVVNQTEAEITTAENCHFVALDIRTRTLTVDITTDDITAVMLSAGSQASYEPYGWAEKITNVGHTTPLYLGEVSAVRRIRKLVLDGVNDGEWKKSSTRIGSFYLNVGVNAIVSLGLCDRAVNVSTISQYDSIGKMLVESSGSAKLINLWLFDTNITLDDFKSYLAQQYAAGTPVTVWYVLATPETGIVNEPLAKIGDYADELHSADAGVSIPTAKGQNTLTVETDLQPSEMTITYKV